MAKEREIKLSLDVLVSGLKAGLRKGLQLLDKFRKGATRAFKFVAKATTVLTAGIAGVVAAVVVLVNKVAEAGDEFQKMAARTELSTRFLSEMRFALNLTDASIYDLQTAYRGMARFIEGAVRGAKEQIDTLKTLGVSLYDVRGQIKKPTELMLELFEALRKISSAALRAGIGQKIFGRGMFALMPLIMEGREALEAYRKEAAAFGLTWTQAEANMAARFRDAMARMGAAWTGLKEAFFKPFMESMAAFFENSAKWLATLRPRVAELGKAVGKFLSTHLPNLGRYIKALGQGLKAGFQGVRGLAGAGAKAIGGMAAAGGGGGRFWKEDIPKSLRAMAEQIMARGGVSWQVAARLAAQKMGTTLEKELQREAVQKTVEWFRDLGETVGKVVGQLVEFLKTIGQIGKVVGTVIGGVIDVFKILASVLAGILEQIAKIFGLMDDVKTVVTAGGVRMAPAAQQAEAPGLAPALAGIAGMTNITVNGPVDESYLRRVLVPELQRAQSMGLL